MIATNGRPGTLVLMADDAPARALASLPGAEFLPEEPDPVDMPKLEDDPFGPSFVLFEDRMNREGEVHWEIAIGEGGEIVAVGALSESLAGPDQITSPQAPSKPLRWWGGRQGRRRPIPGALASARIP